MIKKEVRLHALVAPSETVVVSAYDKEGRADACTLAFYMVSSHQPPCITIAINASQRRKTLQNLLSKKAFVLGFPSTDQLKEADYLGVETGYKTDKLANIGFTTKPAKCVDAPVIDQLLLSLECEVIHTVTIGSHMQITGEVKRIVADTSILDERGKVVLEKLKPLIYDEEQLRYLCLGNTAGLAFQNGIELKKKIDRRYSDA